MEEFDHSPENHEDTSLMVMNFAQSRTLDEKSIQQTPCPRAASTIVQFRRQQQQIQRMAAESFMQASFRGRSIDQSSLGLLPGHLLDFSSGDSEFIAPEFRKSAIGHESSLETQKSAKVNDKELSSATGTLLVGPKPSLTQSEVNFSDDQISARSSTADSYRLSTNTSGNSKTSQQDGDSHSRPFSRLLSRHSLDFSIVASSFPSQSKEAASTDGASGFNENGASESELRFYNIESAFKTREEDEESIGVVGDVENMFEKDEDLLKKANMFKISQEDFDGPAGQRTKGSGASSKSSWMTNLSKHDLTRPSWLMNSNEERGSKISIGEFIAAKTEALGCLDDTLSKILERPHFGIEVDSPPRDLDFLLSNMSVQQDNSKLQATETSGVDSDKILSETQISRVMTEASLDDSPSFYARLVLGAPGQKREESMGNARKRPSRTHLVKPPLEKILEQRHEASGASSFTSSACEDGSRGTTPISLAGEKREVQRNVQRDPLTATAIGMSRLELNDNAMSTSLAETSLVCFPLASRPSNGLQRSESVAGKTSLVNMHSEVVFPTPCCIGASMEASITMDNSVNKWVEGSAVIQTLGCHGEQRSLAIVPPVFSLEPRWKMEPKALHTVKVLFTPPSKGDWEAQVKFSFRTLASNRNGTGEFSANDWSSLPLVRIRAKAEQPNVNVVPDKILDFGLQPEENLTTSCVQLVSYGSAEIPIRLVIEQDQVSGHGFYFPQDRLTLNSSTVKTSSPHVFHSILSSNVPSMKVPVAFKAHSLVNSDCDSQAVSACLRVELDVAGDCPVLSRISLSATVGAVRLFIRSEDELIELLLPFNPHRVIPLRNNGIIPLQLELSTQHPQHLSVMPDNIHLMPGEERKVQVHCQSVENSSLNSLLQINVLPEGPVFTINVVGNLQANSAIPEPPGALNLQCSHRYVYWGTVELGKAVHQELKLCNPSSENLSLNMRVLMDVGVTHHSLPFQIVEHGGGMSALSSSHVRLVFAKNVTLCSGEEQAVKLCFAPSEAMPYSAKLVIKPFRQQSSTRLGAGCPLIKFSVPLRGYGGIAVLHWDGLQPMRDPNGTTFYTNCSLTQRNLKFTARNSGHRAAFVRIVSSAEKNSISPLPYSVGVNPSSFVLDSGSSRSISVSVLFSSSQSATYQLPSPFYLAAYHGDEILRQRLRMLPAHVQTASSADGALLLSDQLKLQEVFPGEAPLNITHNTSVDPMWPACEADHSVFVASLKTHWIMVCPSASPVDMNGPPLGVYAPLKPEETFNETLFHPGLNLRSPPIKEKSSSESANHGIISLETTLVCFPRTPSGQTSTIKLIVKNLSSSQSIKVGVVKPAHPFHVNHSKFTIKPKHYLSLPLSFRPTDKGVFSSTVLLHPKIGESIETLAVTLTGESVCA